MIGFSLDLFEGKAARKEHFVLLGNDGLLNERVDCRPQYVVKED